ncbi:MAG: sulfotransferase domain-containing protein [Planctomycetota bacterium]
MRTRKPKVVLIAGYGRSGSTLLDRLLGQARGFCSAGEFYWFWRWSLINNELCSCGVPIRECGFWLSVVDRVLGAIDSIDLDWILRLQEAAEGQRYAPNPVVPWRRHVVREYLGILERLYSAVCDVSGANAVVDSTKFAARGYLLAHSKAIDLHIIHIVRDARAVAYSWQRHVARPETQGAKMVRKSPWHSALAWCVANASAGALSQVHTRYLLCRYEDLAYRPAYEVGRILEWLGEPKRSGPLIEGRRAVLGASHMPIGNPMRFRSGPIDVAPDTEWRARMPARDRAIVEVIALPMLLRYGY